MKLVGWIGAAVLSLTLGSAAPALARQEQQHEQDKEQKQKDKPSPQKEKERQPTKQEDQHARDSKPAHELAHQPQQKNSGHPDDPQRRDLTPAHEAAHTVQQKSVPEPQHAGRRIPEERFRAHFGQEHRFRVNQADYRRDRRFQYSGYWFGFVDPWPTNWLYTEDVFVVEINGMYYLCNPSYPGINIALSVSE